MGRRPGRPPRPDVDPVKTPMRAQAHQELQDILLTGRHPDGRALGPALAERLSGAFGAPRRKGREPTT